MSNDTQNEVPERQTAEEFARMQEVVPPDAEPSEAASGPQESDLADEQLVSVCIDGEIRQVLKSQIPASYFQASDHVWYPTPDHGIAGQTPDTDQRPPEDVQQIINTLAHQAPISFIDAQAQYMAIHSKALDDDFFPFWAQLRYRYAMAMINTGTQIKAKGSL